MRRGMRDADPAREQAGRVKKKGHVVGQLDAGERLSERGHLVLEAGAVVSGDDDDDAVAEAASVERLEERPEQAIDGTEDAQDLFGGRARF